jgi:D-alanine-D-alanine ligase
MNRAQRIGVLMGGLSAEHPISMKSGKAVSQALRDRGWTVVEIVVDRHLPARLVQDRIDVAWIALHGRFGEDGCVQGLLEVMGIPYTDSGVRASAVAMDKIATKAALAHEPSVVMAGDWVARAGTPLPQVTFPVITKPAVGGSTLGMAICHTQDELKRGVETALALHHEVLLEAFVEGEEITVAVLDGEPLPVVRILPESGFFDFDAKYTEGKTTYEVPASISEVTASQAQQAAVEAYRALGCRGLARVDFIVRSDEQPVFLEINTIPGMTATSLSPMAAGAAGISFEALVERVLLTATCMASEAPEGPA